MTTPAVNQNLRTYLTGTITTYYKNGTTQTSTQSGRPFQWVQRSRGASVSTPLPQPGQIRKETSWSHVGTRASLDVFTQMEIVNSATIDKRVTTNNVWFSLGSPVAAPFDPALLERAVNGALEKLKGQDVNAALAFAERGKTGDLFARTAQRIAKAIQKLRDIKRGKVWDMVKQASRAAPGYKQYPSEYLSMVYGWSPLLQDIDGSCKELAGLTERNEYPHWIEVVKNANKSDTSTKEVDWANNVVGGSYNGFLTANVTEGEKCRVVLRYALQTGVLQKFSELGLTNPAALAWELLPFSFVYDWMHPVGNWLNLLDADFGWDYLNGSASRKSTLEARGVGWLKVDKNRFVILSGHPSNIRAKCFRFQRYRYLTPPSAYYPRIKNPFATSNVPKRIADGMSLLSQVLR